MISEGNLTIKRNSYWSIQSKESKYLKHGNRHIYDIGGSRIYPYKNFINLWHILSLSSLLYPIWWTAPSQPPWPWKYIAPTQQPTAHSVWEFLPALVRTEQPYMWKYKLCNIYYVDITILVKQIILEAVFKFL